MTLQATLDTLDEPWKPLTVAVVNDYDVRVVKVRGEFTWHSHPETDELFHVLSGALTIEMAEGRRPPGRGRSVRGAAQPTAPPDRTRRRDGAAVRAQRDREHRRQSQSPERRTASGNHGLTAPSSGRDLSQQSETIPAQNADWHDSRPDGGRSADRAEQRPHLVDEEPGCSNAAKWPPRSSSFQYRMSGNRAPPSVVTARRSP